MIDTRKEALKVDELVMSKQDVLDMFDGLVKRWKKYPNSNLNKLCIMTIVGFKQGIKITPEKIIILIWTDILKFFNKILTFNAFLKDSGDSEFMKHSFEKFKQEIKDGNFE